ncbi:MAG: hypothetical protein K8823_1649 [Cenarchaeum symbiont of Oopsacas minuta]|nr:hypothetical protein [Cenarchaeum symbiont of Oopsacas minuta]
MKKEFVVKSIDALQDGSPSVIISLTSSKDVKDGMQSPQTFLGSKVTGFTNMNDMMKDINKMISGGANQSLTSIRMDIPEYKKMNLGVGDKVFLEITKADTSGI